MLYTYQVIQKLGDGLIHRTWSFGGLGHLFNLTQESQKAHWKNTIMLTRALKRRSSRQGFRKVGR